MEITDLAILVLKSFLNLFRILVIILQDGGVFRHSSDVLSFVYDVGCYGRVILLPFIFYLWYHVVRF